MRLVLLAGLLFASSLEGADPEFLSQLNVAVLDAHGQPVNDLTAADFQITKDGKPQAISHFRFAGNRPAQAALSRGEFSNRTSPLRPTVVILFDMLNDRLMGDATVRNEIVDSLKNLEPTQNIFLYLLTPRGELFPVHPLPLLDSEFKPEAEPWTREIAPILDQAIKPFAGFHPVDERDIKNRYEQTLAALDTLGGQMMAINGRRNLVWVTHGVPIIGYSLSVRSRVDFTNPLREFYERLARAQILVYPVDQSRRGAGAAIDTFSTQMLQEAADLTGGRLVTSDRVSEALNSAITDSRANYEISYYAADDKPDKKRHKIRVTTTRKELRVQTIQAVYDVPPPSAANVEQQGIQAAIHSPFEATDIGVRASLAPAGEAGNRTVNVLVDPADVMLKKSGEKLSGHLDLVISTYDAKGFEGTPKAVGFDFDLTPAQLAESSHVGLASRQTVAIPESTESIRVVVYDPALNAAGSVRVPVTH